MTMTTALQHERHNDDVDARAAATTTSPLPLMLTTTIARTHVDRHRDHHDHVDSI